MRRLILIVLTAVLLTSCKTIERTEYVPVETVKTETKDRMVEVHDSVYIRDSTVIQTKGDTIFKDRWKLVYKNRYVHDTAYVHRTDSIPVPYPVEKQLSKWQQLKVDYAGWIIAILLIILTCIILIYRFRKS